MAETTFGTTSGTTSGGPPAGTGSRRLDRRQLLRRAAVAGAAGVWAPPVIDAVLTRAAASSSPSAGSGGNSGGGSNGGGSKVALGPVAETSPEQVVTGIGYCFGLWVVPGGPVYVADFGDSDGVKDGRIVVVDRGAKTYTAYPYANTWPSDVAVDSAGNVYFTDYGWDGDDDADTSASPDSGSDSDTPSDNDGDEEPDSSSAEDGRLLVVPAGSLGSNAPPIELATGLADPSYLLLDEANGVVYVSSAGEVSGSGQPADPSGTVVAYHLSSPTALASSALVAGTGGAVTGPTHQPVSGKATSTPIYVGFGLALYGSLLYVADEYSDAVYEVDLQAGTISTYAGGGSSTTFGGPATGYALQLPQGLAVDGGGNLYILDIYGNVLRVDEATKLITRVSNIGTCTDNVGLRIDPVSGSLFAVYNSGPPANLSTLYEIPAS